MQLPNELTPFTSSLQQAQTWIKDMQAALGNATPEQAYTAMRASLHALRDRVEPHEAVDLASQLPVPVAGMYYDGFKLDEPKKSRTREKFISEVQAELGGSNVDPTAAFEATLQVLAVHVPEGQMQHVREMFHKELHPHFAEAEVQ